MLEKFKAMNINNQYTDTLRKIIWNNRKELPSKNYKCGYCDNPLATNAGFLGQESSAVKSSKCFIFICHFCNQPTYFDFYGKQYPGAKIGNPIKHIENNDIDNLFK